MLEKKEEKLMKLISQEKIKLKGVGRDGEIRKNWRGVKSNIFF